MVQSGILLLINFGGEGAGWGGGYGFQIKVLKPKKILKRSIINGFPCVIAVASNLILKLLKVLNF